MKKIITAAAALAALGLAAPAVAQSNWNGDNYRGYSQVSRGLDGRIAQLRQRIAFDVQRRVIPQRLAFRLDYQLRQLSVMQRQYGYGGMNGEARYRLNQRLEILQRQVRAAEQGRGDRDGRDAGDYRDGNDGRYDGNDGRYDGNDGRYDRNDGRYDGNDGRRSDDTYQNTDDGRYQRN